MTAWLLALLLSAAAVAEDLPWYVGRPVAQVSLEGQAGGLRPENLAPLLRTRQGSPLDPGLVRADVHLLVRAGDFAAVDVVVEPWVLLSPEGGPIDAVRVVYRVRPAPKIVKLEVQGVRGAARWWRHL